MRNCGCPRKAIVDTSSRVSRDLVVADVGVFLATALVAPPSEGLEYSATTIPDMNSTMVLNKIGFICPVDLSTSLVAVPEYCRRQNIMLVMEN